MENNQLEALANLIAVEVNRQSSNVSSQRPGLTSGLSFSEAVELELFRRTSRGQSKFTISHFKSSMKKFYNFLESIGKMNRLDDISVKDIDEFVVSVRRENLSGGTINSHITHVRMLFKTLHQREKIDKDPTRFVVLESIIKKKLTIGEVCCYKCRITAKCSHYIAFLF